MSVILPRAERSPLPFVDRLSAITSRRGLWLIGIGMVLFGLIELPALLTMSAHGASVFGFEEATTTRRLNEILFTWGPRGRKAAEAHVVIDLGFIACYGLLLAGLCLRLRDRYLQGQRLRPAQIAAAFACAGLIAASVNASQKLVLWLELHGHTAQPLPAIAAWCATITTTLAIAVVLFIVVGTLAARRLGRRSATPTRSAAR